MAKQNKAKKYIYPDSNSWAAVPESLLASAAYKKSPVTATTCFVFAVIARHYDSTMTAPLAYPGLDRLENRTGLSRETVSRQIKILHQGKWLKRMYLCRVKHKTALESLRLIAPVHSYTEAQDLAKNFKERIGIGCTIGLLFYDVAKGSPSIESLQKKGLLPQSFDEVDSLYEDNHPTAMDVASPQSEMKGETPRKAQQNNNHRTTTNVKLESRDNTDSNNSENLNFGDLPHSKFIDISDRKVFFENDIDEDPQSLNMLLHLKVLSEQGSLSAFEAFRAEERKWILQPISISNVNRLLLKLDYFNFKLPEDLEKTIGLLRDKNLGVLGSLEIQSMVKKMRTDTSAAVIH